MPPASGSLCLNHTSTEIGDPVSIVFLVIDERLKFLLPGLFTSPIETVFADDLEGYQPI